MSQLMTIEDLRQILIQCAGESDAVGPGTDFADYDFDTLGYDSLALMETAAKIENVYGVRISEDEIAGLQRPGDLIALVNAASAATAETSV
jgi:act minimal PKS acyl carrier protein